MHLEDDQIQRFLHGELEPHAASVGRDHLAVCAECRRHVSEAERDEAEVWMLLQNLDHAAPDVHVQTVITAARHNRVAWGGWAAGILLVIGAGSAAYAIPGSPVRTWIDAVVRPAAERLPVTTPPAPDIAAPVAGIAVTPGENLLVQFAAAQTAGHVRVSLVDDHTVDVRAPHGAAAFTSDIDRLLIDNRGSVADFEIRIPRTAPRVEIVIDNRRILLKHGSLITSAVRPDSASAYVLPLVNTGG